jgi:ABC-type phosphate transport system substrate-binding protein
MDQGMARLNGRLVSWVLASCVLVVVTPLTGCSSGSKSAGTKSAVPIPSPVCATGSIQLIGSTAFMPIAQDAAKVYMRHCPGANIVVTGGDSAYGVSKVWDARHSSAAGSMIAMYDGLPSADATTGLRPYPMGVLIFSVVAHTGLFPSLNITTAELRKIFFKPGEPGKVAVGRRGGSGSRKAFDANVLGNYPGAPDKGNCPPPTGSSFSFTSCTEDSTADLLKFVNGTPNAIGYAEVPGPLTSYPQLSVIKVNNAAATPDNVLNGSYAFWTVEHLYTTRQPTTLTRDFLAFLSQQRESSLPTDFIDCSDAAKRLGAC